MEEDQTLQETQNAPEPEEKDDKKPRRRSSAKPEAAQGNATLARLTVAAADIPKSSEPVSIIRLPDGTVVKHY